MTVLTWSNETRELRALVDWERNPREITETQAARLERSLERFGQVQTIAIDPDNTIIDGHQRSHVWAAAAKFGPEHVVDVRVASRRLTETERQELVLALHGGASGQFDWDVMAGFDMELMGDWGFDSERLATLNNDAANLALMLGADVEVPEFPEYDESMADEVEMIECPECGHRFPK